MWASQGARRKHHHLKGLCAASALLCRQGCQADAGKHGQLRIAVVLLERCLSFASFQLAKASEWRVSALLCRRERAFQAPG
jgi:hypothetical protein